MVLNGETFLNGASTNSSVFQNWSLSDYVCTYTIKSGAMASANCAFDRWEPDGDASIMDKVEITVSGPVMTIMAKDGYKFTGGSSGGETIYGTFRGKLYVTSDGPTPPLTDLTVTLETDPSDVFGAGLSGEGTYNYGDTCTISCNKVSSFMSRGHVFQRWSDGGEITHSFMVTDSVTITAYYKEVAYIFTTAYLEEGFRDGRGDYRLTVQGALNGTSQMKTFNNKGGYISGDCIWVDPDSNVSCSVDTGRTAPFCRYIPKGIWVRQGSVYVSGSKISSSSSGSFTAYSGYAYYVSALCDMEISCSLYIARSLMYKPNHSQSEPYEKLTDISDFDEPDVVLANGNSIQMTKKSDHWEFVIEYPEVEDDASYEGFDDAEDFKITIDSEKTAENDVAKGALYVGSKDFTTVYDEKVGINYNSEVVFDDAYSTISTSSMNTSSRNSRAELLCIYSLGPFMRLSLSVSESLNLATTMSGSGNYKTRIYDSYGKDICFKDSWLSGNKYLINLPISGFQDSAQFILGYYDLELPYYQRLAYIIKSRKDGQAQWNINRKINYGGYGYYKVGMSAVFGSAGKDDVFDVEMYIGSFLIMRTASGGIVLRSPSGAIINDS